MKKLWLVLLSLGLVMAFSVSAFAVDVKVGAEYYAAGVYLNKTSVHNGYETPNAQQAYWDPTPANPSTAFFYQDLRVGADFIVSPGLKLVTQFDAMERIWGGVRSDVSVSDPHGAGTRAEAENISVRKVYIDYVSPIGLFKVGYMNDYEFGTVFADRTTGPTAGQIQYFIQKGPFTAFVGYAKETDLSASAVTSTGLTDNDYDSYRIAGIYNFKGGEAGALFLWERNATGKTSAFLGPFLQNVFVLDPYVKAKIGPVALQAEAQYWFGDAARWEDGYSVYSNISISALSVFLDATADLGIFYAGGSFAYLSGQDSGKHDTITGGYNTAGLDWNPCLILFNQDLNYWAGNISGHGFPTGGWGSTSADSEMANAWFGQLRAGVKPTPQLNVMMSVSYAQADKKVLMGSMYSPAYITYTTGDGSYGMEVDITGTYKITNNLSYMLGAGYLFTGDYFKGANQILGPSNYSGAKINDDFILINKLTLSF